MLKYLPLLVLVLIFGCHSTKTSQTNKTSNTENLTLQQVNRNVYQHISYLQTESFGKVTCNGMIVFNKNEAIIFDTPPDNSTSLELINWVEKELHCKIKAIIPTHF
ncbi:MAG: subclass B1 metallo-beta-lactamase, partial [Bacteroidota bacterium]|nr:subclass B1 metallo-beta-lactamase [Bacteroidota bacterium]